MTQCVPGKAGKPILLAAAAAAPGMASEAKAPGTPGIVNPVQDGLNYICYTRHEIQKALESSCVPMYLQPAG